jgi:hypothetical protein
MCSRVYPAPSPRLRRSARRTVSCPTSISARQGIATTPGRSPNVRSQPSQYPSRPPKPTLVKNPPTKRMSRHELKWPTKSATRNCHLDSVRNACFSCPRSQPPDRNADELTRVPGPTLLQFNGLAPRAATCPSSTAQRLRCRLLQPAPSTPTTSSGASGRGGWLWDGERQKAATTDAPR